MLFHNILIFETTHKQPHGWLLDKFVFGVSVWHGVIDYW